jgi:Ni,Fe-hydrogenase III small subunit/Pyruvate/2-oxoacid:ferredoxin oxidoreductase delta subunit
VLNLLKKIMSTGIVTEGYDEKSVPDRFRGEVVALNQECGICGKCVRVCPVNAIELINNSIKINSKACIFCGRCVEQCEHRQLLHSKNYKLATLAGNLTEESNGGMLKRKIRSILGRSLHIRHVDAGSCNACDFEMAALSNPFYDLQQYGIDFVASPRHADMLMVTGVVTRNLTQALLMTYEAVPAPKLVMAVGACASSGQIYGKSYAMRGGVDQVVPVDIYVPGCPPRPQALLYGLLLALDRL